MRKVHSLSWLRVKYVLKSVDVRRRVARFFEARSWAGVRSFHDADHMSLMSFSASLRRGRSRACVAASASMAPYRNSAVSSQMASEAHPPASSYLNA